MNKMLKCNVQNIRFKTQYALQFVLHCAAELAPSLPLKLTPSLRSVPSLSNKWSFSASIRGEPDKAHLHLSLPQVLAI